MQGTWVVIADGSRARICAKKARAKLVEMQTLEHPAGRAKARDLVTDGTTTAFASVGGARHGVGSDSVPKNHEQENFARELARRLEEGRTGNRFDQLVLVAPPAFLGLLRDQLSAPLAKCVTQSLAKDLTQAKLEEIQQQLD
ncbi:MAG: host attachment protein [Myxococcota bacterium]